MTLQRKKVGLVPHLNKVKHNFIYFILIGVLIVKKLWPIWDKVKADLDRKVFNGFQLSFVEIDGDKQEADLNYFEVEFLKSAEKKKVDGYPSIYMIKGDQVYEFEAAPSEDNLKEFVKAVL
jgi:hypothetical protein